MDWMLLVFLIVCRSRCQNLLSRQFGDSTASVQNSTRDVLFVGQGYFKQYPSLIDLWRIAV